MGKWISALVYLLISGLAVLMPPLVVLVALAYVIDLYTLNGQMDALNRSG